VTIFSTSSSPAPIGPERARRQRTPRRPSPRSAALRAPARLGAQPQGGRTADAYVSTAQVPGVPVGLPSSVRAGAPPRPNHNSEVRTGAGRVKGALRASLRDLRPLTRPTPVRRMAVIGVRGSGGRCPGRDGLASRPWLLTRTRQRTGRLPAAKYSSHRIPHSPTTTFGGGLTLAATIDDLAAMRWHAGGQGFESPQLHPGVFP